VTPPRALLPLLLAAGVSACTAYEYEEDVFVELDGSGALRVSGSVAVLDALFDAGMATTSDLRSYFDREGLAVDTVRATEREGRRFLHVQGRFEDWNELCRHPAFRERRCRLVRGEDALELELDVPAGLGGVPPGVEPEAIVGFRFHLPSAVRFHNASEPIQRGNILEWERSVAEHFGSASVSVRVQFDRESVLATTFRILALALGAVVLGVATAVGLMMRKGRRQLAAAARSASASTTR
jgi:hypothetical protein